LKDYKIIIIDFGSQYTQLIARRVREIGVYSLVMPSSINPQEIKKIKPDGLILSGDQNQSRLLNLKELIKD